jgi:hypothetical protein
MRPVADRNRGPPSLRSAIQAVNGQRLWLQKRPLARWHKIQKVSERPLGVGVIRQLASSGEVPPSQTSSRGTVPTNDGTLTRIRRSQRLSFNRQNSPVNTGAPLEVVRWVGEVLEHVRPQLLFS